MMQAHGKSAGRGAGGCGSKSSACIPPRPVRSGAARGGGGVARATSLSNDTRAHSASRSRIDLDDEEDNFYGSRSMAAGGSNMLLNSDEEEDDSDEVTFPALICFTIAM